MRRPPFWASLLTLVGVIILCSLGTWQVQRLHWKRGVLAAIDLAYDSAPQPLSAADIERSAERKTLFLRGTVRGHFITEKSLHLVPRVFEGRQGYHLVTPLVMEDGGTILVNRGWMPLETRTDPDASGDVAVTGLLRKPDRANAFTPKNASSGNTAYSLDLQGFLPYVLYAENRDEGQLPIPVGAKPVPQNNHLSYAIFWFTMAGLLLVIYALRFLVPARKKTA
ncbi:MAG: SURF1 family protein [Micavibrio aeruginosavorus]|nr:SURF1 family protein [Micavibrio aeruginosavorus]